MNSCNIIYPPLAGFEIPYLSGPMLIAYCKNMGFINIHQYDLNAEIFDEIFSSSGLKDSYKQMTNTLKNKNTDDSYDESVFTNTLIYEYLIKNIDDIKNEFKIGFKTDYDYWFFQKIIDKAQMLVKEHSITDLAYSNDIEMITESLNISLDIPHDIISCRLKDKIDAIIKNNPSKYIGISICFEDQLFYSVYLAKYIRDKYIDIRLIAGGPLLQSFDRNKMQFIDDYFDIIIIGEGYDAMVDILNGGENGSYYNANKDELKHPKNLPCPDFTDLNLSLYLSTNLTLPVYPSRGCYWNKCTFCNICLYENTYMQKNISMIVEDMMSLKSKHNCNHFYLSSDTLSIKCLVQLALYINKNNLDLSWQCEVRFENYINEEVVTTLAKGGCYMLRFGLESGSQRILDKMKKGINLPSVSNTIRLMKKYGIRTCIYLIADFPGETLESINETREFLTQNKDYINYIGVHVFELMNNSYIYNHLDEFEGVYINHSGELEYKNPYIDRKQIIALYDEIIQDINGNISIGSIPSSNNEYDKYINIADIKFNDISREDKYIYSKILEFDINEIGLSRGQKIYMHIPTETVFIDQ